MKEIKLQEKGGWWCTTSYMILVIKAVSFFYISFFIEEMLAYIAAYWLFISKLYWGYLSEPSILLTLVLILLP